MLEGFTRACTIGKIPNREGGDMSVQSNKARSLVGTREEFMELHWVKGKLPELD